MKRWWILLVVLIVFLMPLVIGGSLDEGVKKLTYYAEEYETGNINYVQLLIYASAARERLNEILGATEKEEGGILKEEQLKPILGEPTEDTKWVWVEKEEREKSLDRYVPVWRKIVFDGKKIQMRLNAWPSIFKKKNKDLLVYRLQFEIYFKKPKEELNILGRINEIKSLAEIFNKEPSSGNAENLAEKSVSVERGFESYYRQNPEKCEDMMKAIFGSENQLGLEKMVVQEISFYQGENFEIKLRLEMCDDCEWNWISLDFWIEGRGPGFKEIKETGGEVSPDNFKNMNSEELKNRIKNLIDEIKSLFEQKDYSRALSKKGELAALNEAWNQKANDVWKEVEKLFPRQENIDESKLGEYWWVKEEQQRKQKEKEIRKNNYEDRKQFYLNLFSSYGKRELYFEQKQFELRLVEEFKEHGKEICNNNIDDNANEKIDCAEEQCKGKICGESKVIVEEGNETKEVTKKLYCISNTCQAREEMKKEKEEICGNHICGGNETIENCKEDCSLCPMYGKINCTGKVIFKGKDENNCSLEPICLSETDFCEKNEDCMQPLCGKAGCIEGECLTISLEECKEEECADGDEKVSTCGSGETIVVEKCIDSLWKKTGLGCEIAGENITQPVIEEPEEPVAGNECLVKEDCGNENDVCSNGKCVTIPEKEEIIEQPIEEKPSETQEEEQPPVEQPQEEQPEPSPETSPESTPEQTITGQIIKTIKSITGKITGFVITGFQTEEQQPSPEQSPEPIPSESQPPEEESPIPPEEQPTLPAEQPQPPTEQPPEQQQPPEERGGDEGRMREEQEERCKEECNRGCKDKLINPCVNECSREWDCKDNECVEKMIKECEEKCLKEINIEECANNCLGMCKEGKMEEWWQEGREEEMPKEEKGVFKAGGVCRKSQEKTESFLYFDGWGEPFNRIQALKRKYYSGGQAEWCKEDYENLKKQRQEFEKSFNQEFVKWFFEKYLANSAEDWEQHVSGIFELFWRDVDISREMAYRMNCLEINEISEYNLINVKYETEYGKLEFWEEIKTVKLPGMEKEVSIISPYMKAWVFPPKSFISYMMKEAMKNHEFPGKPEEKMERKNEEGITAEEKEIIKQDKKLMNKIKAFIEKYNGDADIAVQFKDYEKNEIVFNLYAQINEEDIIKMTPMLPEEMKEQDIVIEIDFEKVYDLIYTQEKEIRGEMTESPPWDKKGSPIQTIKNVVKGMQMYFKVRSMVNSAKISPESEEKNAKDMVKSFLGILYMMGKGAGEESGEQMTEAEKEQVWESKEDITGEVVRWIE